MLQYDAAFKVVILGEGKTSILERYIRNTYDNNRQMTINASYSVLWDTAGQEEFNSLAPIYYRDAQGAILVYDITYRESFIKVDKWIRELKQHGDEDIKILIVGNKSDDSNNRQVNQKEAEEFCQKRQIRHMQCSAKNGSGIKDIFDYISQSYQYILQDLLTMKNQRKSSEILFFKQPNQQEDKKCIC